MNDYKTKGTYVFTSVYKPVNIPAGSAGVLVVTGAIDSCIKQVWFCDGTNAQIFTSITYPKAYSTYATPVFMKCGFGSSHERSDTGFITTTLTGFTYATGGICTSIRWVAIGY